MIRQRWHTLAALSVGAAALAAAFAVTSFAASSVGQPPPEVAAEGDAWAAHNYDLSNSRATTNTQITSANVATLKRKWSFKIPGSGAFGIYASTPITFGGVVYLQDLNSNVYAIDLAGPLENCQVAPLLFHAAEWTSLRLLGTSELAVRLPALLACLGSLVLFARLARLKPIIIKLSLNVVDEAKNRELMKSGRRTPGIFLPARSKQTPARCRKA